jgi:ribosome maturation factor RimP
LMESIIIDRIARLVEPAVEAEGYYLVDLEFKTDGGSGVLRLFIDKPAGGITLDDCEKVSHLLSPMLDAENIIEGRYFLEVSSPGINRRIKKRADFERFVGAKVKMHLSPPLDGRKNITGIIEGVEGDEVLIKDERSGSQKLSRIPITGITRANLQII